MNPIHTLVPSVIANLTVFAHVVRHGLGWRTTDRERGDVPGWVLITLMTAGLVTVLWALAGAQLETLFTTAISSVTGPRRR